MSLQSIVARVKLWDGTNQASVSASNALKVDGSAVTQPVSVASLPSGAVTNAGTFAVQATEADGANTTLGAKADAKSTATDTTAITAMSVLKQISASVQAPPSQAVTQSGTWTVQPGNTANTTAWKVDGSAVTQPVSLAAGATAIAKAEDVASADADVGVPAMAIRKATPANTSGTDGDYEMLQVSAGRLWASATIDAALPAGSNAIGGVTQSGTWTVQPGNTANTTAWKVDGSAVTQPVSGTVTAATDKSATSTLSNVASSATSVTILASNASRKGATIYNDSTQILYVKFGTTASATSFTVAMVAASYYEVPFQHTGRIDGIWASANGNARVTELT